MINISIFEDFLHLAQSRNFSTSARERGMSQSSLSRRIAQLEDWMGAAVFDRTIQPVSLTPEGEMLMPMALDLIEQAQRIHAIGHPETIERNEVISLIALSSLAMHFIPRWLSGHTGPGEDWRVNLLNTEPILQSNIANFLRGRAEFLMVFGHDHAVDMHGLRHHRYVVLGTEMAIPVTRPGPDGRPLWRLDGPDVVDLCHYSPGSYFAQVLAPLIERRGLRTRIVRHNAMAAVIHSMVREGQGMAWLPRMTMGDDLDAERLVRAGSPDLDVVSEIRLYRSHNMGRRARAFWARVSAGLPIRRKELRSG